MADTPDDDGLMNLATALEGLRQELQTAWEESEGERVRFRVSDVSLTVEAVARRDVGGSAKVRWWLVEAGGEASRGRETTQTVQLSLTPSLYDDDGQQTPLDVAGEQSAPGN